MKLVVLWYICLKVMESGALMLMASVLLIENHVIAHDGDAFPLVPCVSAVKWKCTPGYRRMQTNIMQTVRSAECKCGRR
jgi:hypothetical protein